MPAGSVYGSAGAGSGDRANKKTRPGDSPYPAGAIPKPPAVPGAGAQGGCFLAPPRDSGLIPGFPAIQDAMPDTSTNRTVHIHLVSDATGETIYRVARACLVQFEGI